MHFIMILCDRQTKSGREMIDDFFFSFLILCANKTLKSVACICVQKKLEEGALVK